MRCEPCGNHFVQAVGSALAEQMRHVTLLLGEAQPTFASTRRRKMSPLCRAQLLAFFSQLPRCLEACATAHCWARQLNALGHEVRLMPAEYVKAYIKRNKNDAADAEAICEAAQASKVRFNL
jgi:transposase